MNSFDLDGTLPRITSSGLNLLNDIIIIKVPGHLKNPEEPTYQLASLYFRVAEDPWPADKYLKMMSLDDKVSEDKVDEKIIDKKLVSEANEAVTNEVVTNEAATNEAATNEAATNEAVTNNAVVDTNETISKGEISCEAITNKEVGNEIEDKQVATEAVTNEKDKNSDEKALIEEVVNEKAKEEDKSNKDKGKGAECKKDSGKDVETKKNHARVEKDKQSKDSKGNRGRKGNFRQRNHKSFKPQSGRIKRGTKRPRNRRGRFSDVKPKARDIEPWLNPPGQVTGNSWECQAFMPVVQNPSFENCGDPNMMMYNRQFNSSSFNPNMCNMPNNMVSNMGNNLGTNMNNFSNKRVGLLGDSPYDPQPPLLGYSGEVNVFNRNEESWNVGSSSSGMNFRRPFPNMNARNRQENLRKKSWAGRKNKRWNRSKRRDQGERRGKKRT